MKRLPLLNLFLLFVAFCFFSASSLYAAAVDVLQSRYFLVEFTPESEDTARRFLPHLDEWAREILDDLGFEPNKRYVVRIADNRNDFKVMQPPGGDPPIWSAAVAYPGKQIMVMKTPRFAGLSSNKWRQTFKHECTHLFLGDTLAGRDIPVWLHEGLAQYEGRQGSLSMAAALAKAVLLDHTYTLAELAKGFPDDPDGAHIAYIQSFYFISYLRNEYGVEALHRLIWEIGQGRHWVTALRLATGRNFLELEEEWQGRLKWNFNWYPLLTSSGLLWFVATILFIIGYYKKRRYARLKLQLWELEEAVEDAYEEKKSVDLLH